MVHFEKVDNFVSRILAVLMALLNKESRDVLLNSDSESISGERVIIKKHYDLFKIEIEKNLFYIEKEGYVDYFEELLKKFALPKDKIQLIKTLEQELIIEHLLRYREAALDAMKNELKAVPLSVEAIAQASVYLFIATGGFEYYQVALVEIERQRRILTKVPTVKKHEQNGVDSPMKSGPILLSEMKFKENSLTIRQLALFCIYESQPLNISLAQQLAAGAGFCSKTSGQQLMRDYNVFAHQYINRVGVDGRALTSMIKDISKILPLLGEGAKQQATIELQTLIAKK